MDPQYGVNISDKIIFSKLFGESKVKLAVKALFNSFISKNTPGLSCCVKGYTEETLGFIP